MANKISNVKSKPFVHLHLHTGYSLLDGACRVEEVMQTAAANSMPAVAITDHGVLYGLIDFYKAARDAGVKPILGCETYVAKESRFDRKSDDNRSPSNHLVLLATDETGYLNLVRLVTAAHLEGFYYKPRIDKEILSSHSKGLIGLSACLKGEVASALTDDNMKAAEKAASEYADIFGKGNFFFELQDHGLQEQRDVNKMLVRLSAQTGVPLVATNDVHYIKKAHSAAHEVLLCLQTQTVMSDPKRMRYRTDQFYMKTRAEMEALFPENIDAIERTVEVAERCNVELAFNQPHFPVYKAPDGAPQKQFLIHLGHEGLKHRYGIADANHPKDDRERKLVERFDHEIRIIEHAGFINYFLVVWDFVRFAREQGIPVGPGRGSGGGSIVAYALAITNIDPIRYNLIFERFLSTERKSPPDFDIDFCQQRREEVIRYVRDKYGHSNVAQIITFGSLGAKTVIRDIGRALELPFPYCDRLAKMVPELPKITLNSALDTSPELKKAYASENDCKRILDFAFVLEGLPRNQGTHAAGVVIGEKPLTEIIPLCRDKEGQIITQYDMEPLGEIGLLKMDFLGLRTLTVIREAVDLISEKHGVKIDLDELPMDDKPTYELLNRGDTVGVFQLESPGMRDLIRRIGIDRIEDLIAMIALYRPGPMMMLEDYINRKTGKAKIEYQHPLMKPILEETYGVMLYQEQVQQVANVLAGYTLGEADILRRAMGKKKAELMQAQRNRFIEGCRSRHINAQKAGEIFDTMDKFAGYGFNKSHSAGYGVISYQTAYLKANYPAEFMAALLNSEMGNADKLPVFIAEAREMGLDILPPDVNASGIRFTPDGKSIRYGFAGIKNVGEGAAAAIAAERRNNGPYANFIDFCSRMDSQAVNRKVVESLVRCGAMDSFKIHRARLFSNIDRGMAIAAERAFERKSGQRNLFDQIPDSAAVSPADSLPDCEPWHPGKFLADEKELLGMYMSGHPLTQYAGILRRYQLSSVATLGKLKPGMRTRLGGIAAGITRKVTKQKKPWAIVLLEDLDGTAEVLVFAEALEAFGANLVQDAPVMVCGEVTARDGTPKVTASEIYPLSDAPRLFATRVSIHVPVSHTDTARLETIHQIISEHPGTTPVSICLIFPDGARVVVEADKTFAVIPDDKFIHAVEQQLGEESVFVAVNHVACLRENGHRNRGKTA